MARPIKYHYPRTRLHARILVTTYADLHRIAGEHGRPVSEIVEEAVEEWLMFHNGLSYLPDLPLDEIRELLADA